MSRNATLARRYSKGRSAALALLFALAACGDDDVYFCENGSCFCAAGERCAIPCAAPPCHVECAGDESRCVAECGNGACRCGVGASCDFACHSPPCHVRCEPGTQCSGTCANGTCRCERGASCAFSCESGPCHVQCDGDNEACDGTCANGSCSCGPSSSCHFACRDDNCAATCAAGSRCILECPSGRAGEPGCTFRACAAGEPRVCPGGTVVSCGAPCPVGDAGR